MCSILLKIINLIALEVFNFIVVIKTKSLVKNFKLPPFLHNVYYKNKMFELPLFFYAYYFI